MEPLDWNDPKQLELVKQENCKEHRKDDCYGCIYYDPEDQVCRFDK